MTVLLQTFYIIFFSAVFVIFTTLSTYAKKVSVDVELVLAVDVSGSMDEEEIILQRHGYLEAIQHPEVIRAIQSGLYGRIAVTYIEWADAGKHKVTIPWTVIDDVYTAKQFAAKLGEAKLTRMRRTSIGDALLFAASLIENNSYEGIRRVIDISGDGANNEGHPVISARDSVTSQGIVINGLPILLKNHVKYNYYGPLNIDIYYEDCVIGGPGSFIIPVKAQNEFVSAIRRKIILEVAGQTPKLIPAQLWYKPQPRVSCHQN